MEFKTLFGPGLGGPSDYYRIPSIITTKNGTLVACADARYCSGSDNPNRIDKVVRRSTDGGKTWSDFILAVEEHGTSRMKSSAAIDPILTYDARTNRIYMHYCHTPAGVGILNCNRGVAEDAQGNRYIRKGFKRYTLRDGRLYTSGGKDTGIAVSVSGDVTQGGQSLGNIYTGGPYHEEKTATLMMCYSDDDGLTWSKPQSLNTQVKESFMTFIGPGPGCGIVIQEGKYSGRIVVPIYFGARKFPLCLSCCVIYSDDEGKTWRRGVTPNDTRTLRGRKLNCRRVTNSQMLTESQVIEQAGGTLKYFMRNHDARRSVAVAYSKNGGETWEDFDWDDNLPQPICQNSVLRLEGMDRPYVVFLNAADRKERKSGTVRLSEDGGETFPYSRLLKEGEFVYSSMTQLPNGNIGILFEPDTACQEIWYGEVSLAWIKGEE